jgi:ABC-type lipoprotein export system ATPase subunit
MIDLEGVSKVYRTARGEVRALDNVTLKVAPGDYLCVQGHSGSGKSTLLALIGGLAVPTAGRITVADHEVSSLSSSKRASFRASTTGFVFQLFHLLPYLNIRDNVLVAATPGKADEARSYADELLDRFGLGPRRDHRPAQLSAGERQRVAMARALLNRPRLLLADEPTGNLDSKNADAVLDLLSDFHGGGGTVLLVTHDDRAAACAQRTIALESGRILLEESVAGTVPK